MLHHLPVIISEVEYKIGDSDFLELVECFYDAGVKCFREVGVHEVTDFMISPFEEFGDKNGICVHLP